MTHQGAGLNEPAVNFADVTLCHPSASPYEVKRRRFFTLEQMHVGVEREARRVVPERAGELNHVHTAGELQRGIGVAQRSRQAPSAELVSSTPDGCVTAT